MPEPALTGVPAPTVPAATAARTAPALPALRGAEIAGLGVAVPETVVTNAPIAARLGIDESWIVQRTGIEERRVAQPGERLFELAASAGERALAAAGIEAAELDLVLLATTSNDELMPGASPRVAAAIGAERAGAIDVNSACAGFVSALAVACGPVYATTLPCASTTANCRPYLLQRAESGSGSRFHTVCTTSAADIPWRNSASDCGP